MALFDFLKNKPAAPAPAAAPTPAPATEKPSAGPRYQGKQYTSPEPEMAPAPGFALPEMPVQPFEPTNVLEQLLLLAATDEQARPAFYQALLQEEVLMILAQTEGTIAGEATLSEGEEIQLQVLADGKLPIFSSVARLTDGDTDNGDVRYVRVPGHAFFTMTQGQDIVLNPFSPAGKLLPKEEVAALLAGQLTGPTSPAGGDAQVMLNQPAETPEALLDALRTWATTQPHLKTAYLAQMMLATAPEVPRLLLAFESSSPDPSFLQELGPVLGSHQTNYQYVDLMILDLSSEEGVNPYFRTIAPFWQQG